MHRVVPASAGLALALALTACAEPTTGDDSGRVQVDGGAEGEAGGRGQLDPTAERRGALPDGGTASCVEEYTPGAVAGRSFAFDGTVLEIGPSVSDRDGSAGPDVAGVAFRVHEWFTGGEADTVTVDLQLPAGGSASTAPEGHAYGVGSRLLVSGEPRWGGSPLDAPIAWSCGFSRYHDTETARAWRDAVRP